VIFVSVFLFHLRIFSSLRGSGCVAKKPLRRLSGHGSAAGGELSRAPVPCIGDREVADRYLSSNRLAGAIDCVLRVTNPSL